MADVSKTPGKRTVLNIFPSIGTGVCQTGVRKFNELAASLDNTEVICVSQDLPFAMASFCEAEGIENVVVGSAFRSGFGTDYGVTMADGAWRGLLARSVIVLDADGTVLHTQITSAISVEPDYDAAVGSWPEADSSAPAPRRRRPVEARVRVERLVARTNAGRRERRSAADSSGRRTPP